jgi:hypothetical protein
MVTRKIYKRGGKFRNRKTRRGGWPWSKDDHEKDLTEQRSQKIVGESSKWKATTGSLGKTKTALWNSRQGLNRLRDFTSLISPALMNQGQFRRFKNNMIILSGTSLENVCDSTACDGTHQPLGGEMYLNQKFGTRAQVATQFNATSAKIGTAENLAAAKKNISTAQESRKAEAHSARLAAASAAAAKKAEAAQATAAESAAAAVAAKATAAQKGRPAPRVEPGLAHHTGVVAEPDANTCARLAGCLPPQKVELQGLVKQSKLNGKKGVIVPCKSPPEDCQNRVAVKLDDGVTTTAGADQFTVKKENARIVNAAVPASGRTIEDAANPWPSSTAGPASPPSTRAR